MPCHRTTCTKEESGTGRAKARLQGKGDTPQGEQLHVRSAGGRHLCFCFLLVLPDAAPLDDPELSVDVAFRQPDKPVR